MAESVKQPLSYSRVTKILSSVGGKITIPTTSSYIEYCEDAWLLLRLHNISAAFVERETNSKYYFIDNGLLSLLLVDPTTTLLENLVALSLFRKYGNDNDNERVFFYKQNVEINFYIPDDELAIQVSYSIEGSDNSVIPYKSGITFSKDEPYPCVWNSVLPELKDIDSEFILLIVYYAITASKNLQNSSATQNISVTLSSIIIAITETNNV